MRAVKQLAREVKWRNSMHGLCTSLDGSVLLPVETGRLTPSHKPIKSVSATIRQIKWTNYSFWRSAAVLSDWQEERCCSCADTLPSAHSGQSSAPRSGWPAPIV